jgi:hypothetical protein
MKTGKTYEKYPSLTILLAVLNTLLIYGSGLFIIGHTGYFFSILYLAFVLFLEYRLMAHHCTDCYYWGKSCGFGRGKISSLFFRKGNPSEFCNGKLTWKDLVPDLLVTFIPVVTGIILLIVKFNIIILVPVIIILVLATAGNSYIRGSLTCRFCKQREIGCPAEKLFNKNKP